MLEADAVLGTSVGHCSGILLSESETTVWILARLLLGRWTQVHPVDASLPPAVRTRLFVSFHVFEDPSVDVGVGNDGQVVDSVQVSVGFEIFSSNLEAFANRHLSQQLLRSRLGDADPFVQMFLAVLSSDFPDFAAVQNFPAPSWLDCQRPTRRLRCRRRCPFGPCRRRRSCCGLRWRRFRRSCCDVGVLGVLFEQAKLSC